MNAKEIKYLLDEERRAWLYLKRCEAHAKERAIMEGKDEVDAEDAALFDDTCNSARVVWWTYSDILYHFGLQGRVKHEHLPAEAWTECSEGGDEE